MLSQMDNHLLDLPFLTIGAHSLVVGAVLLSVSLDVDCSYVDGGSFVVLIIDTTYSLAPYDGVCNSLLPTANL
jgi:hypothetical protein